MLDAFLHSQGQVLPSRPAGCHVCCWGCRRLNRGKRTSKTLTAGISPVADVARNWLGRLGIATRRRTGPILSDWFRPRLRYNDHFRKGAGAIDRRSPAAATW
jgi:hypothetical protein